MGIFSKVISMVCLKSSIPISIIWPTRIRWEYPLKFRIWIDLAHFVQSSFYCTRPTLLVYLYISGFTGFILFPTLLLLHLKGITKRMVNQVVQVFAQKESSIPIWIIWSTLILHLWQKWQQPILLLVASFTVSRGTKQKREKKTNRIWIIRTTRIRRYYYQRN